MIVTGTAWARQNQSLGRASTVIPGDTARTNGAASVGDMLEGEPGVSVQKTGRYGASPFIRGFTSYQTLILIDGIRYNNAAFRSGPNQYSGLLDPFAMERLEVVYGPGSVLYGSDAIGGTMSLVSARWSPDDAKHGPYWGRIYSRAGTGDYGWVSNYQGRFTFSDSSGMVFNATSSFFGNLRAGDGVKPYTDHTKIDAHLRFTTSLSETTTLDFIGQYTFLSN
ncbi:MAG: TonB-dependent receptor, partial [Planctomycetota bacterium]